MQPSQRIWHRWAVIPLWAVHFLIITMLLFQSYVVLRLALHRGSVRWSWLSLFHDLTLLLCLGLEIGEVVQYRLRRLRPSFYLGSTAFKAAFFTWKLQFTIRSARFFGSPAAHLAEAILQLLTFYVGLGYAVYIYLRQRKLWRDRSGDNELLLEEHEPLSALLLPARLNSANSLKGESPWAIRLIRYVWNDPQWMKELPAPIKMPLSTLLWALRYALCIVPICILLPFRGRLPGEPKNHLNEHAAPSMNDWSYPKPILAPRVRYSDNVAQSIVLPYSHHDGESAIETLSLRTVDENSDRRRSPRPPQRRLGQDSLHRLLGPRYLCFIADDKTASPAYRTQRVDTWMSENQTQNDPAYVFISYTRKQFYSQIRNDPSTTPEDLKCRKVAARKDQNTLTSFAIRAARDAGVPAFWIDFECVQPEDEDGEESDMEDVYRICDIVRSSHSLAIICGPPLDEMLEHVGDGSSTRVDWLLDWGKRLWTLPEALLCPSEHRISVYAVGSDEPEKIAKRNLSRRLWDDAGIIRQLIDHYEASLQLTQLELISIALECLERRQTETRNDGDVAYALMGLLRLRPKVNKTDTSFHAFARLSLANDSDRILERLISLRNPDYRASWHNMRDTWDARLWHIDPGFQIYDVGQNNTILIGDAAGTSIDWNSLHAVDFTGPVGSNRINWFCVQVASVFMLLYLFLGIFAILFANAVRTGFLDGRNVDSQALFYYMMTIVMILALPVPAVLLTPWCILEAFRGPITSAQGYVFGIAGVPDINQVEQHIFGQARGRLHWNTDGCLAAQEQDEWEEEDQRPIFTLVDTLSMSLTTFRASKPPTMLFVGGRERGMLRVLLCSYEMTQKMFVKESVTRIDSIMNTRLQRLDRFPFSVQATNEATPIYAESISEENTRYDDDGRIELPDIPEFISLD